MRKFKSFDGASSAVFPYERPGEIPPDRPDEQPPESFPEELPEFPEEVPPTQCPEQPMPEPPPAPPPPSARRSGAQFLLLAASLLGLMTPLITFAASPRSSASKGISHYNQEEYDKALTEFLAGLEKAPDRPELKYDLGTALYRMQQFPQAADAFNKAAQKNPKMAADAWFNLGNAMFEGQKFDDAVKAYKNALKLNHDDRDAKHNLELALRAKQIQQQQQPQEGGQDSTGRNQQQKQQQQPQQQQDQQQQEQQQEQQAQAQPDTAGQKPEPQPQPKEGEMSKEEAMQLLQALESDEQEAQKQKLIRQFGEPKRVQKDW